MGYSSSASLPENDLGRDEYTKEYIEIRLYFVFLEDCQKHMVF